MQIKFDLKLYVYSLGLDILLLSFKFNSGLMGLPLQPPRERVLKINKSGFLMIHFTLRDQDMYFRCHDWWKHKTQ